MDYLLTGANGFLGNHIKKTISIQEGITVDLHNSDIKVDLAKEVPKLPFCFNTIIHVAGKAHIVPRTDA